jgi:hypothetical protein
MVQYCDAHCCSLFDWILVVDGFHVRNIGELAKRSGKPLFLPCTAAGVMKLLESIGVCVCVCVCLCVCVCVCVCVLISFCVQEFNAKASVLLLWDDQI